MHKGHVTFAVDTIFLGGLINGECTVVVPRTSIGFIQEKVDGRERLPDAMHGPGFERILCMLVMQEVN